jgi:hypothetical protein
MAGLGAQDMQAGRGVNVIDPKGKFYNLMLNYVPESRIQDCILVNPAGDPFYPIGIDIFGTAKPEIAASEFQTIFNHIVHAEGVRLPETLYHAIITLKTTTAASGLTFVDLMPLLWPQTREEKLFSEAVIAGVEDPYIKAYWAHMKKLGDKDRDTHYQSLRSRIWQLTARSEIRHIIGQSKSAFDMRDVVRGRKILLVNLAGLPEESASLIGSLLINNLWHAIKDGLSSQENPVSLFLDEFHHFTHSPISPETMLAEARSFGLAMHLAHQGLDQLSGRPQLKSAVMNNAVNKIVMQRGADDAHAFAAEFGPPIKDDDLKMLGKYEFIGRVAGADGISPPITGVTRPPLSYEGYAKEVRAASRARYGRPVAEVEAELQARRKVSGSSPKPPHIGDEDWQEGVS